MPVLSLYWGYHILAVFPFPVPEGAKVPIFRTGLLGPWLEYPNYVWGVSALTTTLLWRLAVHVVFIKKFFYKSAIWSLSCISNIFYCIVKYSFHYESDIFLVWPFNRSNTVITAYTSFPYAFACVSVREFKKTNTACLKINALFPAVNEVWSWAE